MVLQALCPSSNCLYTKSKSTMLWPLKGEVGYKLFRSKFNIPVYYVILVNKRDSVYSEIVKCFNPVRARRRGADDQIHNQKPFIL